jgi:pimeloyl-ACP methyl ester carboxylesterase
MIQLKRYGRPTAEPPLFAIPGLDGSAGSVEPVVSRLAEKREVVVVDFSGENNATLEALVEEIGGAVEAAGAGRFDLMGQSIGTILAARLAARPELEVRRVVLTCTFSRARWGLLKWVVRLTRLSPRWLYRLTSPLTIALSCGPVGDGGKHPAFAASRDSDPKAVARRTAWQIGKDFGPELAAIPAPLLILMGERDRFVPDAAEEIIKLRRLLAKRPARVESIANAGHIFLPSAAIAAATGWIESFLSEPETAPAPDQAVVRAQ